MAQELSSNWKKLQAKIKAESSTTPPASASKQQQKQPSLAVQGKKRKSTAEQDSTTKKPKLRQYPPNQTVPKQRTYPYRKPAAMGVTQSSAVVKGTSATVTPSLALWAQENDISAEDLAEAYNLGSKRGRNSSSGPVSSTDIAEDRQRVNEGLAPGVEVGKYIAIDCEMVGVGPGGQDHALARISCVDFHGNQVYDTFVVPREKVVDYRTAITGIHASLLRPPAARSFDEVQNTVADLLKGRILVGHDVRHDLAVLELKHPAPQIRDTSRLSSFRQYGHGPKPALKALAREVLGLDEFQKGRHSSVEDARVAMLLFRARKSEFDVHNANRFGLPPDEAMGAEPKGMGGKNKNKKKKKKSK